FAPVFDVAAATCEAGQIEKYVLQYSSCFGYPNMKDIASSWKATSRWMAYPAIGLVSGLSAGRMRSGATPAMAKCIDFETEPARYRHWRLAFDGDIAELIMDVDENAGLFDGYQLKLNSYDLGVDIELADAVQRLRFEHPEVKAVILRSGKDRVF